MTTPDPAAVVAYLDGSMANPKYPPPASATVAVALRWAAVLWHLGAARDANSDPALTAILDDLAGAIEELVPT